MAISYIDPKDAASLLLPQFSLQNTFSSKAREIGIPTDQDIPFTGIITELDNGLPDQKIGNHSFVKFATGRIKNEAGETVQFFYSRDNAPDTYLRNRGLKVGDVVSMSLTHNGISPNDVMPETISLPEAFGVEVIAPVELTTKTNNIISGKIVGVNHGSRSDHYSTVTIEDTKGFAAAFRSSKYDGLYIGQVGDNVLMSVSDTNVLESRPLPKPHIP